MNAGPTVSLAEAARHSPRSVATLRRWLAAGTIAGAERDAAGAWAIPVAALVEAGAWPSTTPPDPEAESAASDALQDALAQVDALTAIARASDDQAREALAAADVERRLREAAERNAEDLRTALRMLEAGPRPTPEKRPNIFQRLRERGEAAAQAP
jgi:ribonuclease D